MWPPASIALQRTMRALGRPSLLTVARVMALGLGWVLRAWAKSNHRPNVGNGSGGSGSGSTGSTDAAGGRAASDWSRLPAMREGMYQVARAYQPVFRGSRRDLTG